MTAVGNWSPCLYRNPWASSSYFLPLVLSKRGWVGTWQLATVKSPQMAIALWWWFLLTANLCSKVCTFLPVLMALELRPFLPCFVGYKSMSFLEVTLSTSLMKPWITQEYLWWEQRDEYLWTQATKGKESFDTWENWNYKQESSAMKMCSSQTNSTESRSWIF